jgi:FkbM family methyltransferase
MTFNLESNSSNATAMNIALYSEAKVMKLFDNRPGNAGAFSFLQLEDVEYHCEVKTQRLDDLQCVNDQRVGLIKIDTEGVEIEVLKGARKTISRDKPVIIMEDWFSKNGQKSESVQLLEGLGYSTFLEPALFSDNSDAATQGKWSARWARAIDVLLHGSGFGLRDCSFNSQRGYDLLIAIHASSMEQ